MQKSWTPTALPKRMPIPIDPKKYHDRLAEIAELLYEYFSQPSDFELSDTSSPSLNRPVSALKRRKELRQRG